MFGRKQQVVLLVYGKGGHAAQMRRYLAHQSENDIRYITLSNADIHSPQVIENFFCIDARDKFYWYKNIFISMAYVFISIFQMIRILFKYQVTGLISTGPGLAVIPSIICRVLFKKVVFFEDWCRFTTPSIAGRMMYLIADKFYIQEKSLKKFYPKAVFRGRL